MTAARSLVVFLLGSLIAVAQPKFEVASVRVVPANDDSRVPLRGGPGTSEPEQIQGWATITRLLHLAYGLDFDQITGPTFIGTENYAIAAKVPPGTTKDEVKLMWRDLLAERFHFQSHLVQKNFASYELLIAKGGPKLKKSDGGPTQPGFPVPRTGQKWAVTRVPPRTQRLTFRDTTIAEFIQRISWAFSNIVRENELTLGRIVDKTGLTEQYDFTLEFAGQIGGPGGAYPPPLPDGQTDTAPFLIDAIRQQLGLNLSEGKTMLDVMIVDHVDRVPTEN